MTVLFGSLIAATVPSKVKHEATARVGAVAGNGQSQPAAVPAFVSLINFPTFLLAAEEGATASPGAHLAAEALSAKFVEHSIPAGSELVSAEPLAPNAIAVPIDPKAPTRTAALAEDQAIAETPPTAAASDAAISPSGDSRPEAKIARVRKAERGRIHYRRHHMASGGRTRTAVSGGPGADLAHINGFVGMAPDRMLTD